MRSKLVSMLVASMALGCGVEAVEETQDRLAEEPELSCDFLAAAPHLARSAVAIDDKNVAYQIDDLPTQFSMQLLDVGAAEARTLASEGTPKIAVDGQLFYTRLDGTLHAMSAGADRTWGTGDEISSQVGAVPTAFGYSVRYRAEGHNVLWNVSLHGAPQYSEGCDTTGAVLPPCGSGKVARVAFEERIAALPAGSFIVTRPFGDLSLGQSEIYHRDPSGKERLLFTILDPWKYTVGTVVGETLLVRVATGSTFREQESVRAFNYLQEGAVPAEAPIVMDTSPPGMGDFYTIFPRTAQTTAGSSLVTVIAHSQHGAQTQEFLQAYVFSKRGTRMINVDEEFGLLRESAFQVSRAGETVAYVSTDLRMLTVKRCGESM